MTTPISGLPEIAQAQTAYATHNAALRQIDVTALGVVIDRSLTAPPGGPLPTSVYIPASVATGDWAGQENTLAQSSDSGTTWVFYTPFTNQVIYSNADSSYIQYDGANWNPIVLSGGSPLTTKGDIYTYDTGDARLPVGADGQVLTANSATATGLEWTVAGGSVETQDEGITVNATTTTINFVGNGVTATDAGSNETTVTIPGQPLIPDFSGLPQSGSLVHYWNMEEGAGATREDGVGSTDLSDTGTVNQGTGKENNAADFANATTDYLSNATYTESGADFSLSCWVNLDNKVATQGIIWDGTDAGAQFSFALTYDQPADNFAFAVSQTGSSAATTTATDTFVSPSIGVYHHIVAIYDSTTGTASIAVDGNAFVAGTPLGAGAMTASTGNLYFGVVDVGVLALPFEGLIDEVGFWNALLTSGDVTSLYNGGSGLFPGVTTASSPLTTKGDLFTYDTDDQRLPVGTNGQILSANSATSTGLEWIAAPSGGGGFTSNEETLAATKTLANGDPIVQVLNPNGSARDVVLPDPPTTNDHFVIINDSDGLSASGNTLNIKETGAGAVVLTLDDTTNKLYTNAIYTGANWILWG